MLTRDLILPPKLINEALAPGDVRQLKIQISDYLEKINEIEQWKTRLRNFKEADHPAAMIEKLTAIQDKYQAAIDQMEKDAEVGHGGAFKRLVDGMRRNCSDAIELFKQSGRTWYWKSYEKADVLFAKSKITTNPNETMKQIDRVLEKDLGCKAVFANSEIFTRSAGYPEYNDDGRATVSYMVFPTNKSVYTKMDTDLIEKATSDRMANLFDRQTILAVFDMIEDNSDTDTPWAEFCNKAGISYRSRYDVGGWGGFASPDEWSKQMSILKYMVGEGKFPKEILPLLDPDRLVTKDSILKNYDVSPGVSVNDHLPAVLCHGQFYAIDRRFQPHLFQFLSIKNGY